MKRPFLWLVAVVALAAAIVHVSPKVDGTPPLDTAVAIACRDALLLERARLRNDARREVLSLRAGENGDRCPKVDLTRLERTDKLAGAAFARAVTLQRASTKARNGSVRQNRFRVRAIRALIAGARRSPYEQASRRRLTRAIADVRSIHRCRLITRLVDARLLPEANAIAGDVMADGRPSRCIRRQARLARVRRGNATALLEQARSEPLGARTGRQRARELTLRALAADPSVAKPESALAALPPIAALRSTPTRRLRDDAAAIAVALRDAAGWSTGLLGALALLGVAGVVVAVFGSHAIVGATERWEPIRKILPVKRRSGRRRIVLHEDGFGDTALHRSTLATLADTYEQPPVSPGVPPAGAVAASPYPLDQVHFTEAAGTRPDSFAVLLGGVPALGGLAAALAWARSGMARRETRVHCLFMPKTSQGVGLRLAPTDWRGRRRPGVTLRQTEHAPSAEPLEDEEAFHELALVAAEWLRGNRSTTGWQAAGAFRLALRAEQGCDYRRARMLYSLTLERAPEHISAQHNLAVTEMRRRRPTRSLELTERVLNNPEVSRQMENPQWPELTYSLLYNCALAQSTSGQHDKAVRSATRLLRQLRTRRDIHMEQSRGRGWKRRPFPAAVDDHELLLLEKIEAPTIALLADIVLRSYNDSDIWTAAAYTTLEPARDTPERQRLMAALDEGPLPPEWAYAAERYVRADVLRSARAHYNLACYRGQIHAALEAAEAPSELREKLLLHAWEDLADALVDTTLIEWATRDPALATVRQHDGWALFIEAQRNEAIDRDTL